MTEEVAPKNAEIENVVEETTEDTSEQTAPEAVVPEESSSTEESKEVQ